MNDIASEAIEALKEAIALLGQIDTDTSNAIRDRVNDQMMALEWAQNEGKFDA